MFDAKCSLNFSKDRQCNKPAVSQRGGQRLLLPVLRIRNFDLALVLAEIVIIKKKYSNKPCDAGIFFYSKCLLFKQVPVDDKIYKYLFASF